jgi:hypothetical protein
MCAGERAIAADTAGAQTEETARADIGENADMPVGKAEVARHFESLCERELRFA